MNDKEDFVKQVQIQLPPALESMFSDVPEVVVMLAEAGFINYNYPKQDVKKVIQFLPRWFVHRKSIDKDSRIEGKLNAHALLTADYLAESLKPSIKAIRKTYFGSEDSPFNSFEAAEQWYGPIRGELLYRAGLVVVYGELPKDLPEFSSDAVERWDTVEDELMALSAETGIETDSLIYYVLADIKPLTLPYEISMPGKEYCKGRRKCYYVNIKVNTELGFEDLFTIYNTIKEALGVKKGKRLNKRHLELYTMVQERGGAPTRKGAVKFWQLLLKEWNGRHKGEYQEWRCIKRAYDRLCKKLYAQYPTEEVKGNEGA